MELCTSRGIISNLPLPKTLLPLNHVKPFAHFKSNNNSQFLLKPLRFKTGLRQCVNSSMRSEETSTETTPYFKDNVPESESESESEPEIEPTDNVVVVEDRQIGEKKDEYDEFAQGGSFGDKSVELFKFLEDFDIKFDYEDTYSLLVLGGGGVIALWLAAAVVGAIDSIPVIPKMLELVGLGYTVWFTSRYLIFKNNRDELVARVEQIKQQVLGSKDD